MNRKQRMVWLAIALAVALGCISAEGQDSAEEQYEIVVRRLADQFDRALYLAIVGFSSYAAEDQLATAQSLVNLIEGPVGEHYDESASVVTDAGILEGMEYLMDIYWPPSVLNELGSSIYVLRDSLGHGWQFLTLAHDVALQALSPLIDDYEITQQSFRLAYACLLAARGGFDDPFLLAGIHQLAALFPEGIPLSEEDLVHMDGRLQDLLSGTSPGDEVHLGSGLHRERLVITHDITIQGQSPEETIIEGVAWDAVCMILASSDQPIRVVLKDLTIRGGKTGILVDAATALVLERVILAGNRTGVGLGSGSTLDATECEFVDNEVGLAVYATDEISRAALSSCTFSENETAVDARGDARVTLGSCIITDATGSDAGIRLWESAALDMRDCYFFRVVGEGIVLADTASLTLVDNRISTQFAHAIARKSSGTSSDGEQIQDCGGVMGGGDVDLPLGIVTGYGNLISGGVCPYTLEYLTEDAPSEITVSPGESIQAAIDAVADGGTITIEPGGYRESLVIGKSLQLAAEPGAGTTRSTDVFLLGESGVTTISIASSNAIDVGIRGIALRGGSRGIDAKENVSISLEAMNFTELGTALTIDSGAIVRGNLCTFSDNTSAVRALRTGSCTLRDSLIERCTTDESVPAVQSAISVYCSDLTLENCTIRDNQGSGIKLGGGETSRLHMVNCIITGNAYGLELVYGSCNPGTDPNWEPPTHPGFKSHGTISGWGNTIPGPGEPNENSEASIDYYYQSFIDPWFLTEPKLAD